MTLTAVLGIIGALLTLVSVVASAVAVIRANLAKATIDTLKENNASLQERVLLLEKESERNAATLVARDARLRELGAENKALQSYVSGTEAIEKLAEILSKQAAARSAEHHDILAAIQLSMTAHETGHEEAMALIRASVHTHA